MADYSYTVQEPIIEVRNISVSYDRPILRDLSFSIPNLVRPGMTQGQIIAVLAPSGMGKSQLFRCISGLQTPTHGEVYLNEFSQVVRAGMVGVVAQKYPLFEDLTVLENLMLAARRKYPAGQAKEVSVALLERFGLTDQLNKYPKQISGGQQQRVAIIQQIVCSGHLLLMDEPFSGLDPNNKEAVQNLIVSLSLADELNTIILTTHDIGAAISIADTILLLGRDRDATGSVVPGARIQGEPINLIARGLAWRPNISTLPEFHELETEIKARFKTL